MIISMIELLWGGLEGGARGKSRGFLDTGYVFVFGLVSLGRGEMKGRFLPRFWRGGKGWLLQKRFLFSFGASDEWGLS